MNKPGKFSLFGLTGSSGPEGRGKIRAAALLFLVVSAFYLPSASFEFIYDDRVVILRQLDTLDVATVRRVLTEPYYPGLPYHRPLTRLSFVAQKAWHGNNPKPFHLANALLMGAAAAAVFALLARPAFGLSPGAAGLAALVFALHPVASSCVWPIAGRDSLLGGLLIICAFHAWLDPGTRRRVAAACLFFAALMSKEQALILPLVFVLADRTGLVLAPAAKKNRLVACFSAILFPLLAYLAARAAVITGSSLTLNLTRPGLVPLSFWYALQAIFAPFTALVYEPPTAAWFSPVRLPAVIFAAGLLVLGAARFWRRAKNIHIFWAGWFVITLLPTANLLRQETLFDERFLLLPLLGVVVPAAWLVDRFARTPGRRKASAGAAAALVLLLGGLSQGRGNYFRNELVFHRQWLRVNPANFNAWNGLGRALNEVYLHEEALDFLRDAVRIYPGNIAAHYHLGIALAETGELAAAAGVLRWVVDFIPGDADAQRALGRVLARLGDRGAAAYHFRAALTLEPGWAGAHLDMGSLMAEAGDFPAAFHHLGRARALAPGDPLAAAELARLLAHPVVGPLRNPARAIRLAEEALTRAGPGDERLHLALAETWENTGRPAEAARARTAAQDAAGYEARRRAGIRAAARRYLP